MVLNMSEETAFELLRLVDIGAEGLLSSIPKAEGEERAKLVRALQHLGIVKHRLHYGLGLEDFRGPVEWGYPRHRPR